MEYRTLGRTGLRVSRLGFGGAPAGLRRYLTADDRDSPAFRRALIAAIRAAAARGVTYFDTAPGYGEGLAEGMFGEALEGIREKVVLATKFFFREPWDPAAATAALRESLDRLKTPAVDILQYHGDSFDDARSDRILASGVLDWMEEMRRRGHTRFLGITAEAPSGGLERLLKTGRFDVGLFAYSLIYQCVCDYQREPFGIIPYARSLGMGCAVMRPLTSGFLQKLLAAEFPDLPADRVSRMALKFVLSTPEVDVAVAGMISEAEVDANVRLADDPADRYDLRALHHRYV
ncbi:MAG: aldo/keto reductase [Candidatus Coatesbacteria bacterium]